MSNFGARGAVPGPAPHGGGAGFAAAGYAAAPPPAAGPVDPNRLLDMMEAHGML